MVLPLLTHLKIAQLEQYHLKRYLLWSIKGAFGAKTKRNKVRWTLRLKLTVALLLVELVAFSLLGWYVCMGVMGLVILWPTPLLLGPFILADWLVNEYSLMVGKKIERLLTSDNLKIIAITGSFGKTTTKEYLYNILDRWQYTLKTPESYNTLLGIYYVLKKELNSKHKFFICEMGAFEPGDITSLADVVKPDFGIVTAVGRQHMERFGSLEKVSQTKFELVDFVGEEKSLVNLGNDLIREKILSGYGKIGTYSANEMDKADFGVEKVKMNFDGMKFVANHKGKKHLFATNLFGNIQLQNILGAISMAMILKVPIKIIKEGVALLSPPNNRFQRYVLGKTTVIDNTYSSNQASFMALMDDLSSLSGEKALITPGLVELGDESDKIHVNLGKRAAKVFSQVYLIGKTDRTMQFEKGLALGGFSGKVFYEESAVNPWTVYEKMKGKFDMVLMENDLPDSYY